MIRGKHNPFVQMSTPPEVLNDEKNFIKEFEWWAWYPVWLEDSRQWAWLRTVRTRWYGFGCSAETETNWFTYHEVMT